MFYHHTSWPISHQHPLSHIFRDSAAAFSKHKRKGLKKIPTAGCAVPQQTLLSNMWTWRARQPSSTDSLAVFHLSLWTVTVLVKVFARLLSADLTLVQEPIWMREEKKLLDKHWRDCTRRRFRGLKHFSKLSLLFLLLLLLLWWCYILRFANYPLFYIRIFHSMKMQHKEKKNTYILYFPNTANRSQLK